MFHKRSSESYIRYLKSYGVEIGDRTKFRYPMSTTIDLTRPSQIHIGDDVDINANFTIMTHDYGSHVFKRKFNDYISSSGRVSLGNNIYIGRDVTIMKGVSIGDNCIIGLGSIVTKDIPSNSVACGIPCKVVSSIDNYFIKRKQLQISEALSYGRSIILRFNREPQITDFTEEWVLFMSKEDYYTYPEMRKIIDKRIGDFKADFFENNKLAFNGFNEF